MGIYGIYLVSLFLGIFLIPIVIKFAYKFHFVDIPDDRKVHKKTTPRIGGLVIYLSFNTGIILFYIFTDIFEDQENLFYSLLAGGTIIALTGLIDDKIGLKPFQKICGQFLASVPVIVSGIQVVNVSIPVHGGMFALGALSVPVSVLWIIVIINAINLIDGLDGLAGGISAIASCSIAIIAFLSGHFDKGFIALLLVVSIIGFLIYNFYPAKIFMGDTGSMFLGFVLSVFTMQELKQITFFGVLVPLLLLAVPILDTVYALIRRKTNGKPLWQPDKHHFHHKLLEKGFTQKESVFILYLFSLIFSCLGILTYLYR